MKPTSANNWRNLLQRWLRGDSNRQEEQQLEKLSEEDAFLADALDGYRMQPEGQHDERVSQLKARLRQRTKQQTPPQFYFSRIAAVIAFLVVAGAGLWYFNPSKPTLAINEPTIESKAIEHAPIALNEENEDQDQDISTETAISSGNASTASTASGAPQAAPKQNSNTSSQLKKEASPSISAPASPNAYVLDGVPIQKMTPPPVEETKELPIEPPPVLANATPSSAAGNAASDLPSTVKDEAYLAEDAEPAKIETRTASRDQIANSASSNAKSKQANTSFVPLNTHELSGRILDEDGQGLIGANIYNPIFNIGTSTDLDGNFKLEINDSIKQLTVAYTGYSTQTIDIDNLSDDQLMVTMNSEGITLSEVVVTELAVKRDRASTASSVSIVDKVDLGVSKKKKKKVALSLKPNGGLKKYRRYIRRNLQYPAAAKAAGIEGEVIITFNIDDQGQPINLRITQSLGHGCDEEAIRLIREGKSWKSKGGATQTSYTIPFKL